MAVLLGAAPELGHWLVRAVNALPGCPLWAFSHLPKDEVRQQPTGLPHRLGFIPTAVPFMLLTDSCLKQ